MIGKSSAKLTHSLVIKLRAGYGRECGSMAKPKEWQRLREKEEMILYYQTIGQFVGCYGWQDEMLGDRFSPRYFVKQPAGLSQKAGLKC
jgi:hypothetical protein